MKDVLLKLSFPQKRPLRPKSGLNI